MRGVLPLSGRNVSSVAFAREHFLAPGGRMIPLRDEIFVAPVEAPRLYQRNVTSWLENRWELDLEPARRAACNEPWSASQGDMRVLASGRGVHQIEYGSEADGSFRSDVCFEASEEGTVHALALWFDAEVDQGIHFSTGPHADDTVYGRLLLPLDAPVRIGRGDRIELQLRADRVGEDYVWSWSTRVVPVVGQAVIGLSQSTFLAQPLEADRLRRRAPAHTPGLSEQGQVAGLTLELMREGLSVQEIARRLAGSFPARFKSWQDALTPVSEFSHSYGAD